MSIRVDPSTGFLERHVGPDEREQRAMLDALGVDSLEKLAQEAVPRSIRLGRPLEIPDALPEERLLARLRELASGNRAYRSFLGMGYHDTITPGVILRNVMENPAWYTQYTPYQAEVAQGRLEALLAFQTVCVDLTGLEIANASLLDEGTAAAEAMTMVARHVGGGRRMFLVADDCHPQTIEVVRTRARPLDIDVRVESAAELAPDASVFGVLVQYPATDGRLVDYRALAERVHAAGAYLVVATDLLALTLLEAPASWGADVCVGNSQRFGVPMGYGGPHAAFMAARDAFKRTMPGRIIGVSVDAHGRTALRMALQTREQHIRREKATSNICTAQVLLAVMAAMYAVYHGPKGLVAIAERVRGLTAVLAEGLRRAGHQLVHRDFFDTVRVRPSGGSAAEVLAAALQSGINLRDFGDGTVGVAFDEATSTEDVDAVLAAFGRGAAPASARDLAREMDLPPIAEPHRRTSPFLEHPVFNSYHSETEMLRYLHRLASRDLSLTTSMIPLGSCTMKLNATTEMEPVTWAEFGKLHPFVPVEQAKGYQTVIRELESWLAEITGFQAVSLQPNSGAQGEYTGLLVIRAYHEDQGEPHRTVCLIPSSAHGTNPASAVMAGMQVEVVRVDENGSIDLADLEARAKKNADRLAGIMITYPSTHGVFEEQVRDVCRIVHENGGLVYLDGANLNAQVGLSRPGDYGADVCHVNLHKTFAIPHGGGGPGMGPICVNEKLAPYLPGHPFVKVGGVKAIGPVSSAPWGSASILLISWAYIALLGRDGVRRATEVALLNANYMAKRMEGHYDVLFRGANGRVAHEFILDLRPLRRGAGVTEEDVAKRLIDYGFHAPTVSWPVPGTLMIEPTESEPKDELDRFMDALIRVREEVQRIEMGLADREDNVLKNAPHTVREVSSDDWNHPYSREQAAFPAPWSRSHKFWPSVGRVENAYGDRNLVCVCPPASAYAEEEGATAS
jgi:glycine dehydrogenase